MVTSQQVKQQVEQYFGSEWLFIVLATGGWSSMADVMLYSDICIDGKEIRVYPIKTNREGAVRIAIWDYNFVGEQGNSRDDMYCSDEEDLLNIPILMDKFFG